MKHLLLGLICLSSSFAMANSDCSKAKVVCDRVVEADAKFFRSNGGWTKESDMVDAKLCIYDVQLFGAMNPSKKELQNRDKAVTVKLVAKYKDGGSTENRYVLAAYNDYLTSKSTSDLVVIGKSWQSLASDDTVNVQIDNSKNEIKYFMGLNSSLGIRGKKYEAYQKLTFANCTVY